MKVKSGVFVNRTSKESRRNNFDGILITTEVSAIYIEPKEIKQLIKILKRFDKKLNP